MPSHSSPSTLTRIIFSTGFRNLVSGCSGNVRERSALFEEARQRGIQRLRRFRIQILSGGLGMQGCTTMFSNWHQKHAIQNLPAKVPDDYCLLEDASKSLTMRITNWDKTLPAGVILSFKVVVCLPCDVLLHQGSSRYVYPNTFHAIECQVLSWDVVQVPHLVMFLLMTVFPQLIFQGYFATSIRVQTILSYGCFRSKKFWFMMYLLHVIRCLFWGE